MRTKSNVATVKIGIGHMADGQHAGLTHFSTTSYSAIGVKQLGGKRYVVYTQNNTDSTSSMATLFGYNHPEILME